MIDHNDHSTDTRPGAVPQAVDAKLDKRAAARRRFLRIGAAGSSVLMTVAHKRAFANPFGGPVGAPVSNCVSMIGTADLKNSGTRNALATSAVGGTHVNLVCHPRGSIPPSCASSTSGPSPYTDINGTAATNYASAADLADGCGDLATTAARSRNSRLYEKGWCPIKYDAGVLSYSVENYYDPVAPFTAIQCTPTSP